MSEGEALRYMHLLREVVRDNTVAPNWLIKEVKEKYESAEPKIQEFFRDLVSKRMPNFNLQIITE